MPKHIPRMLVTVDKGSEHTKLNVQCMNTENIHSEANVDTLAIYIGMCLFLIMHIPRLSHYAW